MIITVLISKKMFMFKSPGGGLYFPAISIIFLMLAVEEQQESENDMNLMVCGNRKGETHGKP